MNSKNITYITALILADPILILILNQYEIDYALNAYI